MTEYDDHDWEMLLFAPLWSFVAVAGVDDKVDQKEWDAFTAELEDASSYNNPLTRKVLRELNNNFDEIYEAFEEDETEIEDGLDEVRDILDDNEEEDTAYGFKTDMVWLALTVANASKGGLLSATISDKEQAAVAFVADALGLDEDDMEAIIENWNDQE